MHSVLRKEATKLALGYNAPQEFAAVMTAKASGLRQVCEEKLSEATSLFSLLYLAVMDEGTKALQEPYWDSIWHEAWLSHIEAGGEAEPDVRLRVQYHKLCGELAGKGYTVVVNGRVRKAMPGMDELLKCDTIEWATDDNVCAVYFWLGASSEA